MADTGLFSQNQAATNSTSGSSTSAQNAVGTNNTSTTGTIGQNSVSTTDLPAWYQQYTQSLAGQGMGLAQNLNNQPLPAQSTAGFNPDQIQAFDLTRQIQGNWQPGLTEAGTLNSAIPTAYSGAADTAMQAAATPAQSWTENYQKYMSPYTSQVVDNIARLGKRNWENNIMPGINSSMIGSGQFGSTRNADILSRAGVEANNDILGQQSTALQAGYNSGAGIFGNDANRALQQAQLEAGTALNAGAGSVNALNTASTNAGALSKALQSMGIADVGQLAGQGALQQALQQKDYDTAFGNAVFARTDPWTQLTNAQSLLNNVKLPTTQTNQTSGQTTNATTGQTTNATSGQTSSNNSGSTSSSTSGQGGQPASTGASIGSTLLTLAGLLGNNNNNGGNNAGALTSLAGLFGG